jgi:hypothetical protein
VKTPFNKQQKCLFSLFLLLSFSCLVVYLAFLNGSVIRVPYWDQIAWIREYYARDGYLSFIWGQYVDHRNVFSKLLTSLDLIVTGGSNTGVVIIQQLLWAAMAFILVRQVIMASYNREQAVLSSAVILLLSYSTANYVFTAYPINVSFLFVTGFAFLAFWSCFSTSYLFYLTPLFAFLSHISSVNGILVWPLLLLLDFVRHRIWKRSLYLAVSTIVTIIVYFIDYSFRSGSAGVSTQSGVNVLVYFLQIQGLPFSLAISWQAAGVLVGLFLTLSQITMMMHFLVRKPLASADWQAVACVAFSLGTCLLIAWGRYDNTPRVGGRYSVFPAVALMSIGVYFVPRLWQFLRIKEKFVTPWAVTLCVIASVSLTLQILFGTYYTERARDFQRRSDAIIAGQRDSSLLAPIYPQVSEIDSIYSLLKEKRIYMFRKVNSE